MEKQSNLHVLINTSTLFHPFLNQTNKSSEHQEEDKQGEFDTILFKRKRYDQSNSEQITESDKVGQEKLTENERNELFNQLNNEFGSVVLILDKLIKFQEIAKGGQATVYKCFFTSDWKYYALRTETIKEEQQNERIFIKLIQKEMRLLQKLYKLHPNRFTQLVDFKIKLNQDNKIEYDSLHYLGICDLKDVAVQWKKLGQVWSQRDLLSITLTLLRSLQILQESRYCHLDVKPQNIIIDQDYNIKLIDFGQSTHVPVNSGNKTLLSYKGTPFFLAPEIKKFKDTDKEELLNPFQVDIYALGMSILYLINHQINQIKESFRQDINKYLKEKQLEYEILLPIIDQMIQQEPHKRTTYQELIDLIISRVPDIENHQLEIWKNEKLKEELKKLKKDLIKYDGNGKVNTRMEGIISVMQEYLRLSQYQDMLYYVQEIQEQLHKFSLIQLTELLIYGVISYSGEDIYDQKMLEFVDKIIEKITEKLQGDSEFIMQDFTELFKKIVSHKDFKTKLLEPGKFDKLFEQLLGFSLNSISQHKFRELLQFLFNFLIDFRKYLYSSKLKQLLDDASAYIEKNTEFQRPFVLDFLGVWYRKIRLPDNALRKHSQSFEIQQQQSQQHINSTILLSTYTSTAWAYKVKDDREKALEYLNKGIKYFEEIKKTKPQANDLQVTKLYDYAGLLLITIEPYQPKEALLFFQKSLDIRKQYLSEHDLQLCDSYRLVGRAYIYCKENEKALEYFKKAETYFEKKLDKFNRDLSSIYLFQARIYYSINDYYKALEYYLKSLKLLQKYPTERLERNKDLKGDLEEVQEKVSDLQENIYLFIQEYLTCVFEVYLNQYIL